VRTFEPIRRAVAGSLLVAAVTTLGGGSARASDHLDSPAVAADPSADIGDLYAWTAPDGRRLNLVMTLVGHSFSDRLSYVFHVDSGAVFGKTTATTTITCRFASMQAADCRLGTADRAVGDPGRAEGLAGRKFRVFAGLRDDPFFNNVRGSRAAFTVAAAALKAGTPLDGAGCPRFDAATAKAILGQWGHTDGGPGKNFLAGWTPASIVISVDLDAVNRGGPLLAVWGATVSPERQVDRAGRPLTGNALLAPLGPEAVSDQLKDDYNRATPATSSRFVPAIQESLGLYDGYDGTCANGLMGNSSEDIDVRYGALATLLADDRLWVNSAATACTQLFAVERAAVAGEPALKADCGGRAPSYNAVNVYRSLLVDGAPTGVDDGVDRDELTPSDSVFPFLRPPPAAGS